jgi:hypothetical protein
MFSLMFSTFPFWSCSVPCALVTNHDGPFWAENGFAAAPYGTRSALPERTLSHEKRFPLTGTRNAGHLAPLAQIIKGRKMAGKRRAGGTCENLHD